MLLNMHIFLDLSKTLEDFSKTFGKSSSVFYARKFPTKSSRSLPKSSAQSGTKE